MTRKLRDHRFFRDPATMHPACVWALLELSRAFESELDRHHVPRLAGELYGAGREASAALVCTRLDHASETRADVHGPMRAAYGSWCSPMAETVTACASYRLRLALVQAFGHAPLDARVGAYVVTQIALADIRTYLTEILAELDLALDDPPAPRSAKQLAELVDDSSFARRMFRTGAKQMMATLSEIFDELADLAAHLDAERSEPPRC